MKRLHNDFSPLSSRSAAIEMPDGPVWKLHFTDAQAKDVIQNLGHDGGVFLNIVQLKDKFLNSICLERLGPAAIRQRFYDFQAEHIFHAPLGI